MKWIVRGGGALAAVIAIGWTAHFIFLVPGRIAEFNPITPHDPYVIRPEVASFHASAFIGDWHADPTLWARNLTKRYDYGHVDIPRLIEGNVGVQVFTIVSQSPAGLNYDQNPADAFDNLVPLSILQGWPPYTWFSQFGRTTFQIRKLERFERRSNGTFRIIRSRADFEQLVADTEAGAEVVGAIIGVEGGHAFEGDIENMRSLIDNGLTLVGLQHAFDNALGGSLHGIAQGGLTQFGRDVIKLAVAEGLIIDVAHSSHAVVRDVIAMTDIPLVVSHTGIFSHCAINRNLPDDLMQQVVATGGVVGIGYWEDVTCDASPSGVAKAIRAAIRVLGEDHVSLGSDYDGSVEVSMDASEISALTQAMIDEGLSERAIRKVLGENMKRVVLARLK